MSVCLWWVRVKNWKSQQVQTPRNASISLLREITLYWLVFPTCTKDGLRSFSSGNGTISVENLQNFGHYYPINTYVTGKTGNMSFSYFSTHISHLSIFLFLSINLKTTVQEIRSLSKDKVSDFVYVVLDLFLSNH